MREPTATSVRAFDRQSFRPERVICVYENQRLTTDSTFAVPRLLAQVVEFLAEKCPQVEFITLSPDGGDVRGAHNVSSPMRLRHRIRNNHIARLIVGPPRLESTISFLRVQSELRRLAPKASSRTIVLGATMTVPLLTKRFLPNTKCVYWVQGMPRLGQEELAARAIDAADAVVVPSEAMYRDLFQLVSRNRFAPPVWLIRNTVDVAQFARVDESVRARVRSKLQIDQNDWAIAHVGRTPEKGLQIVATALKLCDLREKNVVLVSAGGPKAERRRIAPHAEVLEVGRVAPAELSEVYQACDLGVVPSVWWENCPLALLEMLSLGLCVIGSRCGGIPEVITHGQNGLLVDCPNNAADWATAIGSVCEDHELRRRLASAAQDSISRCFHRDLWMDKWLTVCNSILS